jgi:D-lactate dehydrogenase
MKVLFYSCKEFELAYLKASVPQGIEVSFRKESLSIATALFSNGFDAISIFTADDASALVIQELKRNGVKYIAIRATGYDNVDLRTAANAGIRLANVPEYSPYAIAEHSVALMLALNRKLIRANEQVHLQNFTLDQLIGFDLHEKTVGIIGTGKIGSTAANILYGFGCKLLAYDVNHDQSLVDRYQVEYADLPELCRRSDIITIHVPLNDKTRYMINKVLIEQMKVGVMIINTSRGAVICTKDVVDGITMGRIGSFGADVYEYEKGLFFYDHTGEELKDPLLKQLMSLSNVLVTPHQAFATKEALAKIAAITFQNLSEWAVGKSAGNEIVGILSTSSEKEDESSTSRSQSVLR